MEEKRYSKKEEKSSKTWWTIYTHRNNSTLESLQPTDIKNICSSDAWKVKISFLQFSTVKPQNCHGVEPGPMSKNALTVYYCYLNMVIKEKKNILKLYWTE